MRLWNAGFWCLLTGATGGIRFSVALANTKRPLDWTWTGSSRDGGQNQSSLSSSGTWDFGRSWLWAMTFSPMNWCFSGQVVCCSKYVVRRESARDHVDLLLSTRFWPPVYVTDCAQKVALCADVVYPELTSQMWGRNQGCFSDPSSAPQVMSLVGLYDMCLKFNWGVTGVIS